MWRMVWLLVSLGAGIAPALAGAPDGAQAGAQGGTHAGAHIGAAGPGGRIDCTCRANGQNHPMGARVCLNTAQGWRLATCGMVQNVTSWAVSQEACVVSAPAAPAAQPFRISQR